MNAESVKRIVVPKRRFQYRDGKVRKDGRRHAEDHRTGRTDKAAGGRDNDKPSDSSGAKPQDACLTAKYLLNHAPGKSGGSRGYRGGRNRIRRDDIGGNSTSRIESVPTYPEHSGSDHTQNHAVRRHRLFLESEAGTNN